MGEEELGGEDGVWGGEGVQHINVISRNSRQKEIRPVIVDTYGFDFLALCKPIKCPVLVFHIVTLYILKLAV